MPGRSMVSVMSNALTLQPTSRIHLGGPCPESALPWSRDDLSHSHLNQNMPVSKVFPCARTADARGRGRCLGAAVAGSAGWQGATAVWGYLASGRTETIGNIRRRGISDARGTLGRFGRRTEEKRVFDRRADGGERNRDGAPVWRPRATLGGRGGLFPRAPGAPRGRTNKDGHEQPEESVYICQRHNNHPARM